MALPANVDIIPERANDVSSHLHVPIVWAVAIGPRSCTCSWSITFARRGRVSRGEVLIPLGRDYKLPNAFVTLDRARAGQTTHTSPRVSQVLPGFVVHLQLADDVVAIAFERTVATGQALSGFMSRLAFSMRADEYQAFRAGMIMLLHDGLAVSKIHIHPDASDSEDDKFCATVGGLHEGEVVFLQVDGRSG
ncbi:hypothetical protein FN846DRAFT_903745 [Sphaerosporella brunnea]|uniref:Uncharacterized protein n=1 Tax=Sphaerosporella brunnea TaxID=1250544 RepID=A0A5J5F6M2_9PEZI|nr:hypothetical protein FN846DRAFT_903745 [Sphaerosporella brunnea]